MKTPGGQRRFSKDSIEQYLDESKYFEAPQNPSKYKTNTMQAPSSVKEQAAEYSLFTPYEIEPSANISRLQQQISIRRIRSHKEHYDSGLDIFKWVDEWDFKSYQTKTYSHGFHTYPAMFIPQVARKLIQVFSSEGETVCDIFCGSGTTLVESSLLNRNSIGIELNPLAVLIAKVKTTPIDPQTLTNSLKLILDFYKKMKNFHPQGLLILISGFLKQLSMT